MEIISREAAVKAAGEELVKEAESGYHGYSHAADGWQYYSSTAEDDDGNTVTSWKKIWEEDIPEDGDLGSMDWVDVGFDVHVW